MKLYIYAEYDAKYYLTKKVREGQGNPFGEIELTEDEYFAFEKCEIEYLEWQSKLIKKLK